MKKITFTIITPTFNRLATGYLQQCLASVRNQAPGDFQVEHIVVDDGSTDATGDYLRKLSRQLPALRLLSQPHSGPARAWRNGIEQARGDYLIFLDDDDALTKDSLKKRSDFIRRYPRLDWFYAKAFWIDADSRRISHRFQSVFHRDHLYERMLVQNRIHSGTVVVRKAALRGLVWPGWLKLAQAQDYFLWLELLRPERKLRVGFLDDEVLFYRWHSGMHTVAAAAQAKRRRAQEMLERRIRRLHPSSLVSLAAAMRRA